MPPSAHRLNRRSLARRETSVNPSSSRPRLDSPHRPRRPRDDRRLALERIIGSGGSQVRGVGRLGAGRRRLPRSGERDRHRERAGGNAAVRVGCSRCRRPSIQGFATDLSVDQGETVSSRSTRRRRTTRSTSTGSVGMTGTAPVWSPRSPRLRCGADQPDCLFDPAGDANLSIAATGRCPRRGSFPPRRSRVTTSPGRSG